MSTSVNSAVAASIPRSGAPLSPSYTPPGADSSTSAKPHHPPLVTAGPNTPTSPPTSFMSQSTPQQQQNHVSSPSVSNTNSSTATMSSTAGAPTSQPTASTVTATPPSSITMSTQNSQQPILNTTNTLPTPASSVAGTVPPSIRTIGDEDHQGSVTGKRKEREEDLLMTDRNGGQTVGESTSNRSLSQQSRTGADADRFYLLYNTPYPKSRPHPTDNHIPLYNLTALAASVARHDPVTGEKRAIRKTYKGKIKSFNISGREKEVVHPPDQAGSLIETSSWPAEEWYSQKVAGKPTQTGLSDGIMARLEQAFTMEVGPVPNFDVSILGYEALATDGKPPAPQVNAKATAPTVAPQTNGTTPRPLPTAASPATGAEPPRPKRAGKKRRYDERSFEGYGEGFVDDDRDAGGGGGAGGYDSSDGGGGDKRSGKKKRKTNSGSYGNSVTSPGALERGGSYGVGMVGVGGGYGGR